MTRWMFLGDESCRNFVSRMLNVSPEKIDEESSLVIKRGGRIFETSFSGDGKQNIFTRNIPPEIEIFVPSYSDDSAIDIEAFDNCAIFEQFPFRKDSTTDFARLMEIGGENAPNLLFVLSNTVEDENASERLEIAKNYYTKKFLSFITVESDFNIFDVLHWHKPIVAGIVEKIKGREFQDFCDAAAELINSYETFLTAQTKSGCLSNESKNKIISFESVRGRSHIWMSYQKAAMEILLPQDQSGGLFDLIKLYRNSLYENVSEGHFAGQIWQPDADCIELREKFRQRFKDSMRTPKKFQEFLSPYENKSERIYLSLIRRGGRFEGVAEEFLAQYEYFLWTEVREILISTLDTHIQKLENIL